MIKTNSSIAPINDQQDDRHRCDATLSNKDQLFSLAHCTHKCSLAPSNLNPYVSMRSLKFQYTRLNQHQSFQYIESQETIPHNKILSNLPFRSKRTLKAHYSKQNFSKSHG
ncbi:hypothetical protein CIPAW_03G126000 [Carya illinoinensis]|uniref:Uncharacterized protein n=1 Tax=Carya illinoinensis TaxID=32201 RepID=A0A8T1R036_CARIL|nr:hypothetical protein CIPAW_03G126000 [Carya illinoinensis]